MRPGHPLAVVIASLLLSCGAPSGIDGGATGGGATGGGATGGGATGGGATGGGATGGGATGGGATGGGATGGGATGGGATGGGATGGGATGGGATGGGSATGGGNPFAGIDPLADAGPAQLIDAGFQFTEGPQWVPALNSLLFSDIPANTIFRFAPPASITRFLNPSDNSNGIALAPNGDLIICQHAGRVTRLFPDGGSVVIASAIDGGTLNSPNDAVVRSDGTIYFTDPSYGGTGTVGFRGVYRVDPTTNQLFLVYATASGQPNGVALSPDETILYVADSQLSEVRRFDVAPNGSTSNGARFTLTSVGGPGGSGGDGITTDVNGNLYVTTSVGVKVYRPDAGYLGRIQVGQEPSNCAFGDADRQTLYITARTGLFRVRLNVPGPW